MTRIIAVVSGKGGVGKTSVTVNMGIALAQLGKKVLMIDTDMQMANLGLMLGMEGRPITLQDVLLGEASLADAVYDVQGGARFIPSGLSLEKFKGIDETKLTEIVSNAAKGYDFVLLDTAAGVGSDVLASMGAAHEVLVVTMAESIAVADAMKVIMIAERRLGLKVTGAVVEMFKGLKEEMHADEIQKTLQADVLAVIPEDAEMRMASLIGVPLVVRTPSSPSAVAITGLAAKIAGVAAPKPAQKKKQGFFAKIFALFMPKPKREGLSKLKKELKKK